MSSRQDKPFDISKKLVWEAYRRVKANQGAAGVDGVSIEEFEKDLPNNLFKIWNRMSSGGYFPSAGQGGGDPQTRRHENVGRADRGGPRGADSGRDGAGSPYGVDLS
jgi:hypothetical protein